MATILIICAVVTEIGAAATYCAMVRRVNRGLPLSQRVAFLFSMDYADWIKIPIFHGVWVYRQRFPAGRLWAWFWIFTPPSLIFWISFYVAIMRHRSPIL